MKLFFSPGACSLASHIALLEAGLAFTTERVDLGKKVTAGGADFRAINQKGYVPALQLNDGAVLAEGPVILQYIADQAPQAGLLGAAGSMERYRALEWLNFIGTELHKNFSPLFNKAAGEDMKEHARTSLGNRFGYVERMLEGQQYLVGGHFTAADAYLFTVASWSGFVGFDLSPFPQLQAFVARIAARPAVQEALRAEGLLK